LEFNVTGPPGTGKTTWLTRQIDRALTVHGSDKIMVTSLTRAAAAEVAGRGSAIPKSNIGTLHSFCYRALDRPVIAESRYNEFNDTFPQFRLSTEHVKGLDSEVEQQTIITRGDGMLVEFNLARQRMIDEDRYPARLKMFAAKYEAWKADNDYLDFTDLIEKCIDDILYAPGRPEVLLGDECQDWSRLESALMQRWGLETETFVKVGDPDQSIFEWRGADPDMFRRSKIPVENRRILKQSYRVPKAVHALSLKWIGQIKERDMVEYLPTENDGKVISQSGSFANPEALIDGIVQRTDADKTVMILSTCSYMLEPLKSILRREGIPFHNPYRRSRGDWNPLGSGRGVSMKDRLFTFLRECPELWKEDTRAWTWDDLKKWSKIIDAKQVFAHGAKQIIDDIKIDEPPDIDMTELFKDIYILSEALRASRRGDYEWFIQRVHAIKRRRFDFLTKVIKRRSWQGLIDPPRVIIGTIHSVKGGEADVVYIFPDLSFAGMQEWNSQGRGRDMIVRLFYVALTRAKDEVVILQPSSELNVGNLRLN